MQWMMHRRGTVALAAFLLVGLASSTAWSAGTTAGTPISNSASVSYSVQGVGQAAIESSEAGNNTPGSGAPTVFTVDRKVDVLVSEVGNSFTTSRPGSTNQVLTFLVENEGNDAQDFLLTAVDGSGNTLTLGGVTDTDDFDATDPAAPGIFVDTNGSGSYEAGTDLALSYLDGFAEDTPTRFFIVRNIAASVTDGSASFITLDAQARVNSGTVGAPGAVLAQDTGANVQNDTAGNEQVVFADDDGSLTGGTDGLRDGRHSATDGYIIRSAQLTISKSVVVVRDPFGNVAPNAKSIPGSIVEYEIRVENSASATETATGITISDDLTAEMSGAAGGPRLAITLQEYGSQAVGDDIEFESDQTGSVTTTEYSAASDVDDGEFVSDVLSVDNIALDPGEYAEIRFRVEIQ